MPTYSPALAPRRLGRAIRTTSPTIDVSRAEVFYLPDPSGPIEFINPCDGCKVFLVLSSMTKIDLTFAPNVLTWGGTAPKFSVRAGGTMAFDVTFISPFWYLNAQY